MMQSRARARRQNGMALIEALIASAVLGIGLLGATQLTLRSWHTAQQNRQHTIARQLAQEAMDCLHAHVRKQTAPCAAEDTLEWQGVRFTRQTLSTPRGDEQLQDLQVRVTWPSTKSLAQGGDTTSSAEPQDMVLEWHSSAATMPAWYGVSSP